MPHLHRAVREACSAGVRGYLGDEAVPEENLLYADLTRAIIGAAMEVHNILGPGFLEVVYEEALAHELDLRGIAYERQKSYQVPYKAITAGLYRSDFVVENKVGLFWLERDYCLTDIGSGR